MFSDSPIAIIGSKAFEFSNSASETVGGLRKYCRRQKTGLVGQFDIVLNGCLTPHSLIKFTDTTLCAPCSMK